MAADRSFPFRMLAHLNIAVFHRTDPHSFERLTPAPAWMKRVWPEAADSKTEIPLADRFLFLHSFLEEARAFWNGTIEEEAVSHSDLGKPVLRSDRWTEHDASNKEWLLEAVALHDNGRELLLIGQASIDLAEHRRVLQEGRSLNVAFQNLQQTLHRRDVAFDCLLHDVSGPLANLRDALNLLEGQHESAGGDQTAIVQLAQDQIQQLDDAIQEAMAAADVEAESSAAGSPANLIQVVQQSIEIVQPRAEAQRCSFRFERDRDQVRVVAESSRLRRVLRSLLVRALRRTPNGEFIRVALSDQGRDARLDIIDRGPPLPQQVIPYLFERIGSGDAAHSTSRQALYYCRIAAESWGGGVGYTLHDDGPCVWLRLPKADGF